MNSKLAGAVRMSVPKVDILFVAASAITILLRVEEDDGKAQVVIDSEGAVMVTAPKELLKNADITKVAIKKTTLAETIFFLFLLQMDEYLFFTPNFFFTFICHDINGIHSIESTTR